MIFSSALLVLLLVYPAQNANILFVTTFASVSHQAIFQPVWRELSLRGHNVTAIVSHPLNDRNLTNLTEIDISPLIDKLRNREKVPQDYFKYFLQKPGFLKVFIKDYYLTKMFSIWHEAILTFEEVQNVIHSDQKFDVVVAEWLFPTTAAFAAKFNCPLVGMTSLGAPVVALDTVGNPSHPIYSPDHNLPIGRELSFRERVMSTLYAAYVRIHYHWVTLPREDRTVKKVFGEDMPYIGDIERNISVLLLNRNPIFHKVMPVVPAVIELGGVRSLKVAPPLNPELKEFLDKSTNGVIYFSFGSNFYTSYLSEEIIDAFIKTFEQLPYNVVWKWEKDVLPKQPKNVFIQKWIPQISLLSHPNVKLFITQGGLQSMEETINSHVPIIGVPSHADQTMNVDTAVKYGFGIAIEQEDLSVSTLKTAIQEVMTNYSSFKENIIKIEKLMKDLPFNGLDRAVWWIEYVIRHKGASHLRSPSMDIPWCQYLLLDVITFAVLVLFLSIFIPYKIIKFSYCSLKRLFGKSVKTTETKQSIKTKETKQSIKMKEKKQLKKSKKE